ncbi:unnamed protein product [Paramecium sonneborni]|uniref:Transmembrane protein n=1 Tax=Paramecium sonneborni TaxID=65129 RepID=A0A8S1RR96_9CILI|nr:unnamed protein product [Paramecium sonneborni]
MTYYNFSQLITRDLFNTQRLISDNYYKNQLSNNQKLMENLTTRNKIEYPKRIVNLLCTQNDNPFFLIKILISKLKIIKEEQTQLEMKISINYLIMMMILIFGNKGFKLISLISIQNYKYYKDRSNLHYLKIASVDTNESTKMIYIVLSKFENIEHILYQNQKKNIFQILNHYLSNYSQKILNNAQFFDLQQQSFIQRIVKSLF